MLQVMILVEGAKTESVPRPRQLPDGQLLGAGPHLQLRLLRNERSPMRMQRLTRGHLVRDPPEAVLCPLQSLALSLQHLDKVLSLLKDRLLAPLRTHTPSATGNGKLCLAIFLLGGTRRL